MTSPKPTPEAMERARELLATPIVEHLEHGSIMAVCDTCLAAALTAELERGKALGARECAELLPAMKKNVTDDPHNIRYNHGLMDAHSHCLAIANKHEGGEG